MVFVSGLVELEQPRVDGRGGREHFSGRLVEWHEAEAQALLLSEPVGRRGKGPLGAARDGVCACVRDSTPERWLVPLHDIYTTKKIVFLNIIWLSEISAYVHVSYTRKTETSLISTSVC